MKLQFSRQIFAECSNVKFHKNPSLGAEFVPCGQTDRHDQANGVFRGLAKSSKNTILI